MSRTVEIDSESGFCFGVVTAIRKAEEALEKEGRLYCLGDIVHNAAEVERLARKGLVCITHSEFSRLSGVKVLLRAHGEPPSTYETARRNGIEIIDATCPVVLQLQRRVKSAAFAPADNAGRRPQIVIYGKKGHAEVNGLVGQTADSPGGEALVVQDLSEIDRIDFDRDIDLYSQTTKSISGLHEVVDAISARTRASFRWSDTICRQVANRMDHIRAFAKSHETVIFVSGAKSSNGKVLFNACLEVNPRTYLVAGPEQLTVEMIAGSGSIGICGATSTPGWLMAQVRDAITGGQTPLA